MQKSISLAFRPQATGLVAVLVGKEAHEMTDRHRALHQQRVWALEVLYVLAGEAQRFDRVGIAAETWVHGHHGGVELPQRTRGRLHEAQTEVCAPFRCDRP